MIPLVFHEAGYKFVRSVISQLNHVINDDYEPVVTLGQQLMTLCKIPSLYTNYSQNLASLNINRSVFSLEFASPVTFAAFESHLDSLLLWLNLGCGGGCLKTIKIAPELGNDRPRIQQVKLNNEWHLMNALGLPGKGVAALINTVAQSPLATMNCPIGLSIGGHSLDEYKQVIDKVLNDEGSWLKQWYFEINISCPNTSTGKSLHDDMSDLQQLITYIRTRSNKVISVKVSPDATNENLCDIASLATQFNEVTLNAGNTQFKTTTEVGLNKNAISIGGGGVSGPSLFKRTLEMATLLSQFNLPLISTGGISSAAQIKELQQHGTSIVGMATALVQNPFVIAKINQELSEY